MGIFNRIFRRRNDSNAEALPSTDTPEFTAGDRVKDAFGGLGTVKSVDPSAEQGMGAVCVKMDDGREINLALIASGLQRVEGP